VAHREALPFLSGSLSYARLSAGTVPGGISCPASLPGWVTITTDVAVVTGGPAPQSLPWTVPGEGCFCVKGELTDAAGRMTVGVAPGLIHHRANLTGPPRGP
jgi:hypothetical protein